MKSIKVSGATYVSGYKLEILFSDKFSQIVDFARQIEKIKAPQYKKYQQIEHFKNFKIENGNLVWGEDWDLIFPVDQLYRGEIK